MGLSILQLRHRLRFVLQHLQCLSLAVVGGYHYGNLGDMALGYGILRQSSYFLSSGLQTVYNLNSWSHAPLAVLGGGAVIHDDTLKLICNKYNARNVAFCGVYIEDWEALESFGDWISNLSYFSLRSSQQLVTLRNLMPYCNASCHPDIVFSLADAFSAPKKTRSTSTPVALINVTPRFHLAKKHSVCLDDELSTPTTFGRLSRGYADLMRCLSYHLMKSGFRIKHVPFTPSDTLVARHILHDLPVEFSKYSPNVLKALESYRSADFAFGSRYHSLIFSLIMGLPMSGLAYASKSSRLLLDLSTPFGSFFSLDDLLDNDTILCKVEAIMSKRFSLKLSQIEDLRSRSSAGISTALASLLHQDS
jgi:hypothetical protein